MIVNPVLRGFNPDASAVAVGDDYYIATSTFEWYPGICIYHSKDLANWRLASVPVKALSFLGDESSGGLWAPHLSYADGRFWLVITDVRTRSAFKDTLNYIMTCESVDGSWSEPRFVNASGFDPALFHDEDGKKYFMNMLWDYRPGHPGFAGIVMQEYDAYAGELAGPRRKIFDVTELGVAEGPQIFKKDGWYYLVTAAGGTGYRHAAAIARSNNVWGPYEISPNHPFLTAAGNPDNPLQKSGHVSFLQAGEEWYVTHICARPLSPRGNCPLGRETSLQKVEWADNWPYLAQGGNEPAVCIEGAAFAPNAAQAADNSAIYDFDSGELPLDFHSLRVSPKISLTERPGWLRLYGRESIMSVHEQTLVARRWQSFSFRAETRVDFKPETFQQMAGLSLFYDTENFFYLYKAASFESGGFELNLMVNEHGAASFSAEGIEIPDGTLWLAAEVDREQAQFSYSLDGCCWSAIGTALQADRLSDDHIGARHLVFTGAMIALCCQDLHDRTAYADFDYLHYKETQKDNKDNIGGALHVGA
jgi:xylan 1,4-beta-xylosidase